MVAAYLKLHDQIVELMTQMAALEARMNQNSQNSHKPPTSEVYAKPAPQSQRKKMGRRQGGQRGHSGTTLERVEVADQVVEYWPVCCERCQAGLTQTHAQEYQVRQVHDLPPVKIETTASSGDAGAVSLVWAQHASGISGPDTVASAIRQRDDDVWGVCHGVSDVAN